jgi:hypothetical protein
MVTRYERYYTDIDEKVNEIKEAFYEQKSSAFGHLILKWIFELTDDEVNELITDGYDDNGIDAVYFDDSSSEKVVHFFQFKFPSSTKTMNNGITDMEVLTLFNGFNCFVGSDEDFNKLKWNDMLIEKRNEYKEKEIYNYKIWLIRFTTQELSEKYANLLKGECNLYNSRTGNDLSYETIFVKEAILMYEKNIKKIWPSFKIPYKKTLSPFTDEFSTINSVFIPIKSIYESIEPIEESVYEGNVRYLNPDSNINAGIVETLEKTPRSFHLLNNGITIVCEQCKDNATNQYLDIKRKHK